MTNKERKDIIEYRLERAKSTLLEVDLLLENSMTNTAINRLYYASFYAISALLIQHNINTQTHSGVRQMFGLHFVKTGLINNELGKLYSHLFRKRQISDYDDFVEYTPEEILELIPPTKELID